MKNQLIQRGYNLFHAHILILIACVLLWRSQCIVNFEQQCPQNDAGWNQQHKSGQSKVGFEASWTGEVAKSCILQPEHRILCFGQISLPNQVRYYASIYVDLPATLSFQPSTLYAKFMGV